MTVALKSFSIIHTNSAALLVCNRINFWGAVEVLSEQRQGVEQLACMGRVEWQQWYTFFTDSVFF
ncbi:MULTISPECIES: hypothetical protein [Pseudomonas]|jgi:hypothetical protein|uniref:hypothetical protein n=1 Tax=Pseudomonas TaxID=286 RepID=UPI00084BAD71|nr:MULTISPECIES: hypothetical protein [Pseudomonas]OEC71631.1 hypothetical protein A7D21_29945 [Pseudomonas sp. AP19]OPB02229.1 hypothetical protein BFW91_27770 [Pseudomonas fluorescens]